MPSSSSFLFVFFSFPILFSPILPFYPFAYEYLLLSAASLNLLCFLLLNPNLTLAFLTLLSCYSSVLFLGDSFGFLFLVISDLNLLVRCLMKSTVLGISLYKAILKS